MPSQPRPSLSEKFDSPIWKIETDDKEHVIVIETRNQSLKITSYSAFNYKTGYCYFREKSPENSWWSGLDRVHQGMIYLFGYPTENSPGRKGMLALDLQTGDLCWQQYQVALEGISPDGLLVYNTSIHPKKIQLLSPATGAVKTQVADSAKYLISSIVYPDVWEGSRVLPDYLPKTITGPVFYASLNGKQCWCFHTIRDGILNQVVLIAQDDEILVLDYLDETIQKLNPEAFFIQNDFLFCIRNRSEIVSYLV